jgi:V/A-type H+/Na+-transporting ATPase subunit B
MLTFKTVEGIDGPLIFIKKTRAVGYGEMVKFRDRLGQTLDGQVVGLQDDLAIVQMFKQANGFDLNDSEANFAGETMSMNLSPSIIGRVFDGYGNSISTEKTQSEVLPLVRRDVNGAAINPYSRSEPHAFIQTGISAIDVCNTIVKGQKIPIFSGNGLPDLKLLTNIAKFAKTPDPNEKFVVVVAGIGITEPQYQYIYSDLEKSGAIDNSVIFLNKSSDPVVERLLVPRLALTASEYLAYDLGYSVLTLIFDLTNYANALREVSIAKKEIPGRSGYPGYLYTDLANLLERAGTVHGKVGSITQIPILTMPNMDKTHVVPDLTGYITEGQIVLDQNLFNQGIFAPIDILGSLSRLKDKGQGEKFTREDHSSVADQLFASLSESIRQKDLSMIIGEESLDTTGRAYLQFLEDYKSKFLNQGDENRSIQTSLDIAWDLFKLLPRVELKKIKDDLIKKYKPEILA